MDKAHNDMSEDAHSSAQPRQQTKALELLAISELHPIIILSCLADMLSMKQANLEGQVGELDTGREAMAHSDQPKSGAREEPDTRYNGFHSYKEDFMSFVNRLPRKHDSECDTGYATESLVSSSPISSLSPSRVSEYWKAVEWPLGREKQPDQDSHEAAQREPEQAPEQKEQAEGVINDIIEAHRQVVEKQADQIYRLTNVASQLEVEFLHFAEEEHIKIKDSTDRVNRLLEVQEATERQLRRAEEAVELSHSLAEQVRQLSSNLHDANAEVRRLEETLHLKYQALNSAMRTADSLEKMCSCATKVIEKQKAQVCGKDATIGVMRRQLIDNSMEIASLNSQLKNPGV